MILRKLKWSALMGTLFFTSTVYSQVVTLPQASPKAKVSQTVGISEVTVEYSRPNVISPQGQDRTGNIWGALVPYGYNNLGFGTATEAPWRAGANENTVITFSDDATIEGQALPAGTYGLHVAVEEDGSATVIFSNKSTAWGSFFYNKNEDALRVSVQTEDVPQTNLLTYHFPEVDNEDALLALDWEKKRIPINIHFDTPELTYHNLKAELESSPGFEISAWMAAANYLVQHNIHLDDALVWASNAVEGQFYSEKKFQTLQIKGRVLSAMGKTDEAEVVMEEALSLPSAAIGNYYNYGRQLIGQDKDEKALEIFKKANKKWPEHWLAPHGLARGYAATGDFNKAVKYEKMAVQKAPENSKPILQRYIKSLEEGNDIN